MELGWKPQPAKYSAIWLVGWYWNWGEMLDACGRPANDTTGTSDEAWGVLMPR